jgi:hypothetical protein
MNFSKWLVLLVLAFGGLLFFFNSKLAIPALFATLLAAAILLLSKSELASWESRGGVTIF